jgi:hypothetical protein
VTHLGERVSALVDGQLPVDAIERAHAHLANCRDCRDAVEAERLMKARLSCLPAPGPGADLVARLLAMGGPAGPLPPRPGHVPGTPRPEPVMLSASMAADPSGTGSTDLTSLESVSLVSPESVSLASLESVSLESVSLEHVAYELVGSGQGPARDRSSRGGPVLAGAPVRLAARRPAPPRTSPVRPSPSRPAGRSIGRRRARLAGAVLGALGVVGVGVGGLVLASPNTSGGSSGPLRAPLDSFVVQRSAPVSTGVSADVSLQLRPVRSFTPEPVSRDGR